MKLETATLLAHQLVTSMRPFCHRVEIAGSIRRRKGEVKDIEIVAVPRWRTIPGAANLFGESKLSVNSLCEWATGRECPVQWIKPGTSEIVPWKVEAEGRYWRGMLPDGIKLDLFLCEPDNWGAIYLIRTGSAEFSYAVATHAKQVSCPFTNGRLTKGGQPVATREEWQVFDILGIEWREPEERTNWQAVCAVPDTMRNRRTDLDKVKRQEADSRRADRFVWLEGDIEIIKSDDDAIFGDGIRHTE